MFTVQSTREEIYCKIDLFEFNLLQLNQLTSKLKNCFHVNENYLKIP